MKYKVPSDLKVMFILNIILFVFGFIAQEEVVIATSVIIFALLSVTQLILEAISNLKN